MERVLTRTLVLLIGGLILELLAQLALFDLILHLGGVLLFSSLFYYFGYQYLRQIKSNSLSNNHGLLLNLRFILFAFILLYVSQFASLGFTVFGGHGYYIFWRISSYTHGLLGLALLQYFIAQICNYKHNRYLTCNAVIALISCVLFIIDPMIYWSSVYLFAFIGFAIYFFQLAKLYSE